MKRLILGCWFLLSTSMTAQAQKVYKESEMFIIECAGMPADSYTKVPKSATTDGTDTTVGTNSLSNIGSAVSDEKVAYKFEVAPTNLARVSSWTEAVSGCAALGAGWRMPTLREMMLMVVLRERLKALPGFSDFTFYHTCATEYLMEGEAYAYVMFLGAIYINLSSKSDIEAVRCIRDL